MVLAVRPGDPVELPLQHRKQRHQSFGRMAAGAQGSAVPRGANLQPDDLLRLPKYQCLLPAARAHRRSGGLGLRQAEPEGRRVGSGGGGGVGGQVDLCERQ